MENRVTKAWVKNHFHYSWWKYLMALVASTFGVSLLFAVTAYRPPEEKKIEIYLCSGYADTQAMYDALWPEILSVCPDQEELSVLNIDISSDDYYTQMQFTTYAGAQQGDLLLLPKDRMKELTQDGADTMFTELTPYIESGALNTQGLDLNDVVYQSELGEDGVYAIPADHLYGLLDYSVVPRDTVLCVTGYSGNEENVIRVLNMMLEKYATDKPDWYHPENAGREETQNATQIF